MTYGDDLYFDSPAASRHAEELRRRARLLEEEVRDTEIDVTSRDKSITVTVAVTGKIRNLTVATPMAEERSTSELTAAILAAVQRAQEIAEQTGKDMANRYFPNLPDFRTLLAGRESER